MFGSQFRRLVVEKLETRLPLDAHGIEMGPLQQVLASEQVIVMFRDDLHNPRAEAQSMLATFGGKIGHVYEQAFAGFSAHVPLAVINGLSRHPLVQQVEIDHVLQGSAQILPTGIDRINAELNSVSGEIGTGKEVDIDIAIIDTGIANHPDLNIVGGQRFYTVTGGPPRNRGSFSDLNYSDDNGHGTHVAGIAAAKDNDFGVVGMAPGARLWAVKVLDSSNSGYTSDIIKGVEWVTANADVIEVANMSLGGVGRSDALRTAIQNSVAAGVVYVAAAGNDWGDIHGLDKTFNTADDVIPAAYPEVATIAAFADSDGQPGGLGPATSWGQYGEDDAWWGPSNFSNSNEVKNDHFLIENPVDSPGLGIDLMMPGADILSTWNDGGYRVLSGTSMAAPHAAGLAALYIAANGRATDAAGVYEIRQALIDSGKWWNSDDGLAVHWGPAAFMANVGWAGEAMLKNDPTVEISSPADGEVVWGDVVVTASATVAEGAPFVSVDIWLGGDPLGELELDADTGLWNFTWATVSDAGESLYPDGTYQLTVVATDNADRSASDSVSVTVANFDEKPTVEIISPSGNATLSGTVEVLVKADDDRGVDSVEVLLGNTSLGHAIDSGNNTWALAFNSANHGDDSYNLRAVATDSNGQTSESNSISLEINNSQPTLGTMAVDLSGRAVTVNRNFWRADVIVKVTDDGNENVPLSGVEVRGSWSNSSDTVVGMTDGSGYVTFSSANLRSNISQVDFSVLTIQLAHYADGASSTIRVLRSGATQLLASASPAPLITKSDLTALDTFFLELLSERRLV